MKNYLLLTTFLIALSLIMSPYIPDTRYSQIIKAQASESAESGSSTPDENEPNNTDTTRYQWVGIAILFVLVILGIFKLLFGGTL